MTEETFIITNDKRKRQALMEAEDRLTKEDELNETYNPHNYNVTQKQADTLHRILTNNDDDYARSLLRKKKKPVKSKLKRKPKKKVCRCKS